jgi:hypothetical protein
VAPPPSNINHIQALAAALVFPDYKIVGLNAETNNPGTSGPLGTELVFGGEVQKITSGTAPVLIINVTDTDYSLPPNPPTRLMQSIGTVQFTDAPAGDNRTAQAWFNPSNSPYARDFGVPPAPFAYTSTGLPLNGVTQNTGEVPVPTAGLYGLTAQSIINMTGAGGDLVFGGSVRITSIPEPTSLVIMLPALPVVIMGWFRHRKARATSAS